MSAATGAARTAASLTPSHQKDGRSSPVADTISTGAGSSEDKWSVGETPLPQPGMLQGTVRRAWSAFWRRKTDVPDGLRDQVFMVIDDNDKLKKGLELLKKELEAKDVLLRSHEGANHFAQEVLRRNRELEQYIHSIQDELEGKILNLHEQLWKANKDAASANDTINELRDSQSRQDEKRRVEEERLKEEQRREQTRLEQTIARQNMELLELRASESEIRRLLEIERDKTSAERTTQLASIAGVKDGLEAVIEENKRLEDLLQAEKASSSAMLEKLRAELREKIMECVSKESEVERLRAENEKLSGDVKRWRDGGPNDVSRGEMERLLSEARKELKKLNDSLAESEKNRGVEVGYLNECLRRKEEKIEKMNVIYSEYEKIIKKNMELNEKLNSMITGLNQSFQAKVATHSQVTKLKSQIQQLQSENSHLQAEVASLSTELQLLKKVPEDKTDGRLEFGKMIEEAVQSTRQEVERTKQKYETLLSSLREAHAGELAEYRRRSEESVRKLEAKLKDKVELYEQERRALLAASKGPDSSPSSHASPSVVDRYKAEYEASMKELMQQRESEWQKRIAEADKLLQEHIGHYERKLDEAERLFEKEKKRLRAESDRLLMERGEKMSSLEAKVRVLEASLQEQRTQIENEMRSRLSEEFKSELEALHKQYSEREREYERSLEELERAHTDRIRELERERRQWREEKERLVHLNDGTKSEMRLESLIKEFEEKRSLEDRRNDEMLRSVKIENQKLAAILDEKEKLIRNLQAQSNEQNRLYSDDLSQLHTQIHKLQETAKNRSGGTADDLALNAQLSAVMKRNVELEHILAELGDKYHQELSQQLKENANTKSSLQKLELQLQALERELDHLRKFQPNPQDQQRYEKVLQEIAALKGKKAALEKDLENEKLIVANLSRNGEKELQARSQLKRELLNRLKEIESTMRAAFQRDAMNQASQEESARLTAEKKRLSAQIEFYKQEAERRQETITQLENRVSSLFNAPSTETNQLRDLLTRTQAERSALAEDCKALEEQLGQKKSALEKEIANRNQRLSSLRETHEKAEILLERNKELENKLDSLLKELQTSISEADIVDTETTLHRLTTSLVTFEAEIKRKSEDYVAQLKDLAARLKEKDSEIGRLLKELDDLRESLNETNRQKLEAAEKRHQAEANKLKHENEALKQAQARLEADLRRARLELEESQAVDRDRLSQIVDDFQRKLRDHELLVAKIQDEKDAEVSRVEAKLNAARAAQRELRSEIETVSTQLTSKETEISELSVKVSKVLEENRLLAKQAEEGKHASEAEWRLLRDTLEDVFEKLQSSQAEAAILSESLQALLREQESSLVEMAKQQAAVQNARSKMQAIVEGNRKPMQDYGSIRSETSNRIELLRSASGANEELAVLQAEARSRQEALNAMKEKAAARDSELSRLRAKLSELEMTHSLEQDLKSESSSPSRVLTTARELFAREGTLEGLSGGVKAMAEQLAQLEHELTGRRSPAKPSSIVRRTMVFRDESYFTQRTTTSSTSNLHPPDFFNTKRRSEEVNVLEAIKRHRIDASTP